MLAAVHARAAVRPGVPVAGPKGTREEAAAAQLPTVSLLATRLQAAATSQA